MTTIPCDHCDGSGSVKFFGTQMVGGRSVTCGACMGTGKVNVDGPQIVAEECSGKVLPDGTNVRFETAASFDEPKLTRAVVVTLMLATRAVLTTTPYLGQHVIEVLTDALPFLPYEDRKELETEVAEALFHNRVDPNLRTQWETLVDQIRRIA